MRLQVRLIHLGQPGIFVGREHTIRRAGLGQQLAAFKYHLVFGRVQCNAHRRQRAKHPGVARDRLRLIVMRGKHGFGMQRIGKLNNALAGNAVLHNQACAGQASQFAQIGIQVHQAFPDELDAAVGTRQRVQNFGIENEDAMDPSAVLERCKQRRVVVRAQVAAKPHQTGAKLFVHDRR